MPLASFKEVREVSSEDEVHSADNLLKEHPGRKWKTKNIGEKSAYVILELAEPHQITGIDIGNEHSAFVEVFVGKAGCTQNDFTEILITSSFMTPIESKNSTNTNRVRCFSQDALVPSVVPNKWKLIKIVCTQPFNKHVKYGISFIKVHAAENVLAKKEPSTKILVPEKFHLRKSSIELTEHVHLKAPSKQPALGIGKFALREDSPDSDSESTANLFNRWKQSRNINAEPTAAAAIRQASGSTVLQNFSRQKVSCVKGNLEKDGVPKEQLKIVDRNREDLLYNNDDDEDNESIKNQHLTKQIEADKERVRLENEKHSKLKEKRKLNDSTPLKKTKPTTLIGKQNVSEKEDTKHTDLQKRHDKDKDVVPQIHGKKRHSSPIARAEKRKKSISATRYTSFNQLFQGVVLVISGIQNPSRADLRRKALAMGAKYKTDWDQGCTHLICAFKNTPKYNQVKGKGKIVTKDWLEKSFELKKKLPWRRYALDTTEQEKTDSEGEIWDESLKPSTMECIIDEQPSTSHNNEECIIDEQPTTSHNNQDTKNNTLNVLYNTAEDEDMEKSHNRTSGSDTEDEIERVKLTNAPKNNGKKTNLFNNITDRDIYEVTTEEEDFLKDIKKTDKSSHSFFTKYIFYIGDDASVVDKMKLRTFIPKYGGCITENLLDAHYVISDSDLCLKKLNVHSFNGQIVRPLWIYECNDLEVMIPITRYLV